MQISVKNVPKGEIDNKLALAQVVACLRIMRQAFPWANTNQAL